ncbi:DUF4333 domain-containing protein [Brachybacterium hainanense]|uniref:DUF4333 domain-containing protein n=1 Tax=Brachybacterium hainanense TaxID=1541174 RepID=A0ABV6RGE1_9MICO
MAVIRTRPLVLPLMLPALAAVLAGCSFSFGGDVSVAQEEAEKQIIDLIGPQLPEEIESADCPGSLAGEVGTTMTCTITVGGASYDTILTVTSVEGKQVNFDIDVPEYGA